MLFGHNSNVTVGDNIVHVQTEDRGTRHAFIDTTVHWKGRILHRRTAPYNDLLPLDSAAEATLKNRVDEQHRAVIDEIRTGVLKLALAATASAPVSTAQSAWAPASALKIELLNAKSWLVGRIATLQLVVRDANSVLVPGANARARVECSENPADHHGTTGNDGATTLQFEMPKLTGGEAALVIEAERNGAKGHLRFQLRAKPKT